MAAVFDPVFSPRIKKSGGYITWNSLGQPHVNGRLAMTRSIGDFDLKNMGVIAEPETRRLTVSASPRMLGIPAPASAQLPSPVG